MKKPWTTTLLLAVLAAGAQAQVDIEVDLGERGTAISDTHYGIFFEDINHAADGGLYAELIRNRSFDENSKEPQAWSAVGGSTLRLTGEGMLNEVQTTALEVDIARGGGGVQNEGFWGISAVQGQQYRLSLWVKVADGKPGTLTARLRGADGSDLGSATLTGKWKKGQWQKLETALVATGTDPQARFELTAEGACRLVLDVVSLFPPTYKNRPNGMRPQLAEMLAAMKPRFMRFPGGCYVEGQEAPENAFRWERTIGPIEERPGHWDANWRYWTTDGMGFHEFLQLSEDLGAKPLYVVNVGIWHGGCTPVDSLDGWIQECMDALEYANGPVTSKYGALRAKNGHPEPFNIEYLEIGNENANFFFDNNRDQSERYHERYQKFYEAVKAKYPAMNCIGNVEAWGTDTPSWRSELPVDLLDEHYYRNPAWFLDAYRKYDDYDRQGPKIYVGEYAVTSQYGRVGNMNAAIGEAVYMLGMERNSDVVVMNSYAPIFVNDNASNWPTDMIHFNSAQAFGTPSYWVQQLFPTHTGNVVVGQKTEWQLPDDETPGTAGQSLQVGLASWNTEATYSNARLIVDGAEVALPSLDAWQDPVRNPQRRPDGPRVKARQAWVGDAENGTVSSVAQFQGLRWMCPTAFTPREKYSFRVTARKNGGQEGFLVVVNGRGDKDFDWMNIGGWDNTRSAMEQTSDGSRTTIADGNDFRVEEGRDYELRVDVEGDSMAAYVDGQLLFTARHKSDRLRGVFSVSTLDEENGTLYVKLVNAGEQATTGSLRLKGGRARSAEMVRLAGAGGKDENTMDHPLNIIPRSASVSLDGDGATATFDVAPSSVNILTFQLKND